MKKLLNFSVLLSCFLVIHLRLPGQHSNGTFAIRVLTEYETNHNIDSMKWIMYSLNYKKEAIHYKYDSLNTSVVSLDVNVFRKYENRKDTVIYIFHFFKGKEKYGMSNSTNGIGYSNISHTRFLVADCCFPIYTPGVENPSEYIISESDRDFREFLSCYKGDLSPWLKAEAIRRKVIN
jgi:hypothetical protein